MTSHERANRNGQDLDKVLAVALHNLDVRDHRAPGPMIRFSPTIEGVIMSDHTITEDVQHAVATLFDMWTNGNRIDVVERLMLATQTDAARGLMMTVQLCSILSEYNQAVLTRLLSTRQE